MCACVRMCALVCACLCMFAYVCVCVLCDCMYIWQFICGTVCWSLCVRVYNHVRVSFYFSLLFVTSFSLPLSSTFTYPSPLPLLTSLYFCFLVRSSNHRVPPCDSRRAGGLLSGGAGFGLLLSDTTASGRQVIW